MNHTYRIVWNHVFACYQVVSETAKGGGKSGKSLSTLLGGALLLAGTTVLAGPQGGQVTAGTATITQSGTITTINQSSGKAAIDWTRFSVGANETVRFNQPNASSITLNRVTGTESSAIMGNLSANGQIFILNPNGVLFGAGSQVNVGGLVASTLRLDNASFMAGNYRFSGAGNSSVVNNGSIKVEPGGTIALMAPVVQNTGSLQAPGGHVLLAGAQGVTLSLQSDGGLIAYTLDAGSAKALVDNGGLIEAGGGHVVLTAKGVDALSTAVVNHSGVIEAQTVSNKGGVIELLGDMQSGSVNVSGKLDASAPTSGNGGFVETSAAQVHIADTAQVTTRASAGATGKWLIDPTDFTISAGTTTQSASGIGAITLSQNLANTDVAIATAPTGTGNGDIFVNSAVSWVANKLTLSAHRNININANLNASGIAQLALEYGQATANGSGASYYVAQGAKVNLPSGQNFSTKQGAAGALKTFTVINALGAAGSTTGSDLQGVNGNLAHNYVLGSDIDASTTTGWNAGRGFDSIGKASAYTGEFDGLGHTISNLSINRSDSVVGLFGVMSGVVRNLGVVNANVVGAGHAGILAGTLPGSVTRSYSTGSVRNSSSIGSVGGLIGSVGVPGAVSQSFSTADVDGRHAAGGLVGFHFGVIEDSYATGRVFNNTYAAGGLVGLHNGTINKSYATGQIVGSGWVGGLTGFDGRDRPATTTNSYWDTTSSGVASSASGTGKTTAQMQQQATYVGWDFDNIWGFLPGSTNPTLRAFNAVTQTPILPTTPIIVGRISIPDATQVVIASYIRNAIQMGSESYDFAEGEVQLGADFLKITSLLPVKNRGDVFKNYFVDPLIDESIANLASITTGQVIAYLEEHGFASKRDMIKKIFRDPKFSGKVRSKIIEDAKTINPSDMAKGYMIAVILEVSKDILKEQFGISRDSLKNAAEDWMIEQTFLLAGVYLTGGTPIAGVIAETKLTYDYLKDDYEVAHQIGEQNTANITSIASILNNLASLKMKIATKKDEIGQLNELKMEKLISDSLVLVNTDLLPAIKFNGIDIITDGLFLETSFLTGKELVPVTEKLYLAKTYKLAAELFKNNGNLYREQEAQRKAADLIFEVQEYAFRVANRDGGSAIVQGVRQLIRDIGLLDTATQLRQG